VNALFLCKSNIFYRLWSVRRLGVPVMLTDKQCKSATHEPDRKRARFTGARGLCREMAFDGGCLVVSQARKWM
jgi:hypothetical protein